MPRRWAHVSRCVIDAHAASARHTALLFSTARATCPTRIRTGSRPLTPGAEAGAWLEPITVRTHARAQVRVVQLDGQGVRMGGRACVRPVTAVQKV